MFTRTLTLTAAGIGATVLAATGITYASSPASNPAPPPAQPAAQPAAPPAAPPVQQAAPAAAAPGGGNAGGEKAVAAGGGNAGGEKNDNRGHEGGENGERGHEGGERGHEGGGRGHEGGERGEGGGRGHEGGEGGHEGGEGGGRGHEGGERGHHHKEGRIFFNERTFSAHTEGCITTASGLGATSFNVFNDSWRTIEVFRGFNCDHGGPVAVVGPHSSTNGVVARHFDEDESRFGGAFDCEGVVGSFRVIGHRGEW
ncbi:hypothetical protein ACFV1W_24130 [Kitasatospora sp. NPDC059648]|uniref:hypothetical protein n=1 Tax=Kitasatospora sp. NPDC059648 TaxID=3346894 RepID=UPI00367D967D